MPRPRGGGVKGEGKGGGERGVIRKQNKEVKDSMPGDQPWLVG